jgi:hypothetical protein
MDEMKVREIEQKIAELEKRWPAHSVPTGMWEELEELEFQLRQAQEESDGESDAG